MRDAQARRVRVRRSITSALAGLTLASLMLAVLAYRQTGKAKEKEEAANKSAGEAKQSEADAKASEAKAKQEKRLADIQAATLDLEKGVQVCEQGRPRLGILTIAHSLQICPLDATELRRVILTNLAAWGPHLLCLDEIRTFDNPILATDSKGKYALVQLPKEREERANEIIINKVQLFEIATGKTAGPPVQTVWSKNEPFIQYQVSFAHVLSDGVCSSTAGTAPRSGT